MFKHAENSISLMVLQGELLNTIRSITLLEKIVIIMKKDIENYRIEHKLLFSVYQSLIDSRQQLIFELDSLEKKKEELLKIIKKQ